MVNQEWIGSPFVSSAEFLPFGAHSDHALFVVSVKEPRESPIHPFRYYNMWASHPKFQGIVREVWSEETPSTNEFALCRKLKVLKHPLKQLNKREFGIFLIRQRRSG